MAINPRLPRLTCLVFKKVRPSTFGSCIIPLPLTLFQTKWLVFHWALFNRHFGERDVALFPPAAGLLVRFGVLDLGGLFSCLPRDDFGCHFSETRSTFWCFWALLAIICYMMADYHHEEIKITKLKQPHNLTTT